MANETKNTKVKVTKDRDAKMDYRRFWLGAILAVLGIVMLFIAMFIDPQGKIDKSIIGAVGEIFLLSGSLLGLDSYFNFKLRHYLGNTKKDQKEE